MNPTHFTAWKVLKPTVGGASDRADPGGRQFNPLFGHISFVLIDHEIISMAILPLPLIQEEQLSVTAESMCTSIG